MIVHILRTAVILSLLLANSTDSMAQRAKDDPAIGRHLYYSYCAVCHGLSGTGDGPLAEKFEVEPADLTSDEYQKKSVEQMTEIIGNYEMEAEVSMPQWRRVIAESNLRHIAAFIPMFTQTDLRLRGDIRRGELVFLRSCIPCHGRRGKGNGVIIKILGVKKMVDFTDPSTLKKKTDKAMIEFIKKGSDDEKTYMPAWKGILSEDDIINAAAYVKSLRK